jgi:pumilio RNA-binding family
VVQKVLEVFDVQFHSMIVSELVEQLKECVCDPNGNHVVQKAVERASPALLQPVVDILRQDVFSLATHLYGCRVMQRVLEYCISEQSAPVLELIVTSGSELLRDQFGNYVVQHVIECGPAPARSRLLALMCGALPELAVHKFASNVVEKVLRSSSPTEVVPFIAEFLTPKRAGAPVPLQAVMRDQFGNYVIQCIIDISQGDQREAIAAFVMSEKEELKKYSYGKHILAHLEKTMPDSSRPHSGNKAKAKGGGSKGGGGVAGR